MPRDPNPPEELPPSANGGASGVAASPEEQALVRRLREGDAAAFTAFYADYFPRVYRFVLARGGDARWVEDVTQAALVQAMSGLAGYRGDAPLFSWLCRIALREAMRAQVKQQVRDRRETSIDAEGTHDDLAMAEDSEPEAAHARAEARDEVHALLDGLPPRFGDVLEMKYVEGLSVQEIATRMQTGATAVQSLLARARGAFRSAYARRHGLRENGAPAPAPGEDER